MNRGAITWLRGAYDLPPMGATSIGNAAACVVVVPIAGRTGGVENDPDATAEVRRLVNVDGLYICSISESNIRIPSVNGYSYGVHSLVLFPSMPHKHNTDRRHCIVKMLFNLQNRPQHAHLNRTGAMVRQAPW
jgi:hypothetical protein